MIQKINWIYLSWHFLEKHFRISSIIFSFYVSLPTFRNMPLCWLCPLSRYLIKKFLQLKFYLFTEIIFFSWILISKMSIKMNFRVKTKNHGAESKKVPLKNRFKSRWDLRVPPDSLWVNKKLLGNLRGENMARLSWPLLIVVNTAGLFGVFIASFIYYLENLGLSQIIIYLSVLSQILGLRKVRRFWNFHFQIV